jgi:hypothetical protein
MTTYFPRDVAARERSVAGHDNPASSGLRLLEILALFIRQLIAGDDGFVEPLYL